MILFLKECRQDFLLSVIEMIQFKDRIFREVISKNLKLMEVFSQSSSSLMTNFMVIPAQCPKSAIVFGDGKFQSIAKKLYDKYVKEDSPYETLVDLPTMTQLEKFFDKRPRNFDQENEKEDPVKL